MRFYDAQDKLRDYLRNILSEEVIFVRIIPKEYGWVFFYEPESYLDTGNILLSKMTKDKFFVSKKGDVVGVESETPVDDFLEKWESEHNVQQFPCGSIDMEEFFRISEKRTDP